MRCYTLPNPKAIDQSKIECFVEVYRHVDGRIIQYPYWIIEQENWTPNRCDPKCVISLFLIKPRLTPLTPSQWDARCEELNSKV